MNSIRNDKVRLVPNFIIVPAPQHLSLHPPTALPELTPSPEQPPVDAGEQQGACLNRKKYPKDDYQKNITINVVKCCIRQMLGDRFRVFLRNKCEKMGVQVQELLGMVEPILKEVVISLGDLKNMLTSGEEREVKVKKVFCWFLHWYLRNRYIFYLLSQGKMNHKERYIEYKNKYMLSLLKLIRQNKDINSPIRTINRDLLPTPPVSELQPNPPNQPQE